MTHEVYTALIKDAAALISKKKISIDASEIVSDAYIMCVDANDISSYENIRKYISNVLYIKFRDKLSQRKNNLTRETHIVCRKCNEIMPPAMFRVIFDKRVNKGFINRTCIDCLNKYHTEWYKKKVGNTYKKRIVLLSHEDRLARRRELYRLKRGELFGSKKQKHKEEQIKHEKQLKYTGTDKEKNAAAQRAWYQRNKERLKSDKDYLKKASERSWKCQLRKKEK